MFSLKQKQKKQFPDSKIDNKDKNDKKKKNQSKKINKTIFEDPFHYKIQLIPNQQAAQLSTILDKYIEALRLKMPVKAPRIGIEKFIKFDQNKQIQKKRAPLICEELIIGTKSVRNRILAAHKSKEESKKPKFVIIFYQQTKHEILQQLLCLIKHLNIPYIITRQNNEINRHLGIKTAGVIGFLEESFTNNLLKYIGMSHIEIPWLIQLKQELEIQL